MTKVAVVGAGHIGKEHARVVAGAPGCVLHTVVDTNVERAREVAERHGARWSAEAREVIGQVDAAVVAVPTESHLSTGRALLESGIDCLMEKPIAGTLSEADILIEAAERSGRVLQVGHLERFNPAVTAALHLVREPRFIEIHRLGTFVKRSLDIDVVTDLMIHDIDIVLSMVRAMPREVRAVGVPILSRRIDICNARLEFDHCVANVTASRVSKDKIRKVRVFQPDAYISLDYQAQAGEVYRLVRQEQGPTISLSPLEVARDEPLKVQFSAFLDSIATRRVETCTAIEARRALDVALQIVERARDRLRME
ncbi:MAG: Gfo/Idh/MocA family oxidoreductase [Acidobacteriota bacterium]